MGIELPPELADVAAQAGVAWPEADEEAMARQAEAWRDTATSMSTLATDADTTARAALSAMTGDTATAASTEWKAFVEPDTGHVTSLVKDANTAANRLEHAADQVGAAKVEIVRNLVGLAQNQDAAQAAASAGHPFALAGLDTAVRGTAANVANIESQLVTAVHPNTGVDMASIQNPVNANPGHHLPADVLSPGTTTGVGDVLHATTSGAADLVRHAGGTVADTADQVAPGAGDLARHGTGGAADVVRHAGGTVADTAGHVPGAGNLLQQSADHVLPGGGRPGDVLPGQPDDVLPGRPDLAIPTQPGDPEVTGPVPPHDFPGDVPTPPTGQTVQAGFASGLEAAAAPAPANLPPAAVAPPLNPAAPAPGFAGTPGFAGAPAAPVIGGAPVAPAPVGAPAAALARPATFAPVAAPLPADRPPDPVPRKQMAGPPGAPPPARGEPNEVLTAFWLHMFPIGHLPVASYRPARQLPPPPEELDYAAGLRFEPADHPQFHLVDPAPRLAELQTAIAQQKAAKEELQQQHYTPATYPPAEQPPPDPETVPSMRPVIPSVGITADHPAVQSLLENHDPLGGGHERDWDRRYLVRLGSVTAHGISPEGLEYNWPTSEQYPEGGCAQGEPEVLDEDTVIDRFGTPHGRVFAADGTPFAQRSLPPAHKDGGYRRYRITKPLPVWRAVSAAWFGQPGGGVRYRTTHSAAELVALGYLEEIA